jgi:HlyD family secretion protein
LSAAATEALSHAGGPASWGARRHLAIGLAALLVLVFGFGGWAVFTRLAGAVVAPATVEVEGNRQVVQHPTGGVVDAILARNGDVVEQGAVLLRFEGDQILSDLAVVEGQFFEILARKDRLRAERDDLGAIAFEAELAARAAGDPATAELLAAQVQQFETRRAALREETAALTERKVQINRQIEGLGSQRASAARQAEIQRAEVAREEQLYADGLTRQTQLLREQQELAQIEGSQGQIDAAIAENRARIAEIDIEVIRLVTEMRKEAIAELRDLEFREIELREKRLRLQADAERLELRAPATGVVYGSTADTLRAVMRPADPILYIVPQGAPLVVRAQVEPINVDEIRPGQPARLRFSSFSSRTTPEIDGVVERVSADAIQDERTGLRYYTADIAIDAGAAAELGGVEILPGMPVEAFIQTGERTPLNYLTKPFTDYFAKAFRET